LCDGRLLRDASARGDLLRLSLDIGLVNALGLRLDALLGCGLQLLYRSLFVGHQGRASCPAIENLAVVNDRPPALLILPERLGQDGWSLEHQALGRGDRTVDDRPVQHLARRPELDPAQAVQPAPLVERRQEAFGISAVARYDIPVQPTGA